MEKLSIERYELSLAHRRHGFGEPVKQVVAASPRHMFRSGDDGERFEVESVACHGAELVVTTSEVMHVDKVYRCEVTVTGTRGNPTKAINGGLKITINAFIDEDETDTDTDEDGDTDVDEDEGLVCSYLVGKLADDAQLCGAGSIMLGNRRRISVEKVCHELGMRPDDPITTPTINLDFNAEEDCETISGGF